MLEVADWPYILKMYIYKVPWAFKNILWWPEESNPLIIKMIYSSAYKEKSDFKIYFLNKKEIINSYNVLINQQITVIN